jgi:hypothetical protein
MHPYAGLINHSCDYNSTVGFDGEELYVKAMHPIKKDLTLCALAVEEVAFFQFIAADVVWRCGVDVGNEDLLAFFDGMHFDCQCTKCQMGAETLEDRFLSTPEDMTPLETAEREALELMQKATATSTEPAEAR